MSRYDIKKPTRPLDPTSRQLQDPLRNPVVISVYFVRTYVASYILHFVMQAHIRMEGWAYFVYRKKYERLSRIHHEEIASVSLTSIAIAHVG